MTPEDDLSELRRAWDRAAPRPDPGVRAAHLRLARENFERLHAAAPARAEAARGGGAWAGLRGFLASFAHPGAATGATAVAALALLMVTPTGQTLLRGPLAVGEAGRAVPEGAAPKEVPAAAGAPEAEEAGPEMEAPGSDAPVVAEAVAPEAAGAEAADAAAPQGVPEAARPETGDGADARIALAPEAAEAAPEASGPAMAAAPESVPAPVPVPVATAEAPVPEAAEAEEAYGSAVASTERAAGAEPASGALAEAALPEGEVGAAATAADSSVAADATAGGGGGGSLAEGAVGDMVAMAPVAPQAAPAETGATANVTMDAAAAAPGVGDPGAASLAAVREALDAGALPAPEAVDVQGLVDRLAPLPEAPVAGGAALRSKALGLPAPWDAAARLVVVAVQAAVPVEGAELSVDGAAALGGPEGALPLGALEAGGAAVRVFLATGAGVPGPVRLRWTDPLSGQRREAKAPVAEGPVPPEAQAVAAVAGWALLLREGKGRLGGWGFGEAAALAEASLGGDPVGRGAEAVELMRRSEELVR